MESNEKRLEERIKQLEVELAESQTELKKHKTLFNASGDALSIIDLDTGKFIECNEAAIRLHGVGSEEHFLNLTPADTSPEYQPSGRLSSEMAMEYIQKTFSEGPQVFQWEHSKLDGATFPCLVSLTALPLDDKNLILAIGRDISDLVQAKTDLEKASSKAERYQTAYKEEKEKFESLVELAPIGVAINRMDNGAFDYVNREFSHFSGYEIDELNKMDYWELTPKKYEAQEQEQLNSLQNHGRYGPYEKEYIHKNGYTYPVVLSGVRITTSSGDNFICSIIQDVSDQKNFEQQLFEAKEYAEAAVFRMKLANDSAGIGIWELDLQTNELKWDDWMYSLYGYSGASFSNLYEVWENSVHPEDIAETKSNLEAAIYNQDSYEAEFRIILTSGEIKTIKASAEIIRNHNGDAVRIIGVNYDITDKVNAIKQLNQAKQDAEDASQAKSDFLANMSHEIRTPMNAILGGLQLLKTMELEPKLSTILDNSLSSAKSLLIIINDILDYSKIEDNKLDLEAVSFSFLEVIKSVKFDVDPIVSNKGIELRTEIDDSFKDGWIGDVVRVKQILLNLISNAVKFTEHGSVTIDLRCIEFNEKTSVSIRISDTGIGMSDEAKKHLFERFTQADSSTTRKFGGTGLGMSITLSLIRIMNGTIKVESELGQGTSIQVILPLDKSDFESDLELEKSVVPPNLSGKKILIAEDNEINQVLIESMLEATQADLTVVENGKLAVEAQSKQGYDLTLMDIQMPVMDGVDALKHILRTRRDAKVIALTANVMSDDVEAYLKQGFLAHIAKPIDLNNLYGVLSRHIN